MTHLHPRYKPCPECKGDGWTYYERPVRASISVPEGYIEEYTDTCVNCDGSGEIEDDDYDEEEMDHD